MKTLEDLDEADSADLGNGYLLCVSEVNQRDCSTSIGKRIFGLVVSGLHILQTKLNEYSIPYFFYLTE